MFSPSSVGGSKSAEGGGGSKSTNGFGSGGVHIRWRIWTGGSKSRGVQIRLDTGVELRVLKNGLFCVHVRAGWYTTIFRVSFRGLGFRCVDLAQKISARSKRASNTGSYVFTSFFICILFSFLHYHLCMFFLFPARSPRFGNRMWKDNIVSKKPYHL